MKKTVLITALALALAACGKKEDNNATDTGVSADMGGQTDTGGTGSDTGGGTDTGGGGTDTGGGGTDTGGTTDMGGSTDTGGTTDTGGADTGTADMGGTADTGGTMHLDAHGCTFATATDMTSMASVSISDISAWTFNHNACVIVSSGTAVSWTGNFNQHPLSGGVGGTEDATSPIDIAGDGATGNTTVTVTLDTAADYGYFCDFHSGSMNGVVYVID